MVLAPKLQLRQSQSLVMTPQLLQSIRLLQLPHGALERFLDDAIERNPLLERAGEEAQEDAPEVDGGRDRHGEESAAAMAARLDTSLENLFPDDPGPSDPISPGLSAQWKSASGRASGPVPGASFDLEGTIAAPPTLHDHLSEQIAFAFSDPAHRLIAHDLTTGLDDAGYLAVDLDAIAERLDISVAVVARVLAVCQTFEPAGLFARDLRECLALQLRGRDRLDPAMQAMIDHLPLLAKRDFSALGEICDVDTQDLADMVTEIRLLDPKPGTAFTTGFAATIVPDVLVRSANDGGWAVDLNPESLPRVLVNERYHARISKRLSGDDEAFVTQCLQDANWLVRSLDQRARTILKVASAIVRHQDGFLVHGVNRLRPLTLRDIAAETKMHESTVSRVTANKFMATPRGNFELRYFFSTGLASSLGGEAHAAKTVRDRIRHLVEAEGPETVLSDDAIVGRLRSEGVDIARRTVAKYREVLNIPSSIQRRREKKMLASSVTDTGKSLLMARAD